MNGTARAHPQSAKMKPHLGCAWRSRSPAATPLVAWRYRLTTYETKQTLVLNEWMGQGMMWSTNISCCPGVSRMQVECEAEETATLDARILWAMNGTHKAVACRRSLHESPLSPLHNLTPNPQRCIQGCCLSPVASSRKGKSTARALTIHEI